MQQAVQYSCDRRHIAQQFAPVFDWLWRLLEMTRYVVHYITKSILSVVPAGTIFEEEIQSLVTGSTDRIR